MAKQGSKIDENTRLNIYIDYIENGNASEVAKKYNVSGKSVARIVEKLNKNEKLSKLVTKKKDEQVKNTLEEFEKLGALKSNIINNSLVEIAKRITKDGHIKDDSKKKISIGELTRIYGVLMDKEISYASIKKIDNTNEMNKLDEILESIKDESTN